MSTHRRIKLVVRSPEPRTVSLTPRHIDQSVCIEPVKRTAPMTPAAASTPANAKAIEAARIAEDTDGRSAPIVHVPAPDALTDVAELTRLLNEATAALKDLLVRVDAQNARGGKASSAAEKVDRKSKAIADLADKRLLDANEVAALLGKGRSTLYQDIAEGKFIQPICTSPRSRRWQLEDVTAWINARKAESIDAQKVAS